MKISFVIPAYNEEKYIGKCIQSILDHWSTECLEIIVADNASTDNTKEAALKFPHVKVFTETNKGTNWARQRGFIEAKGDIVAYLDADAQIPDGWRERVVKEFSNDPKLVSLSGPFHYYDLPPLKKFAASAIWWCFVPIGAWITGYAALGANMAIKREALKSIGGFDTSILFHGDDTDTARRLSRVGKVKFRMDFFILGSGRRFIKKGLRKTFWEYGVNYAWIAVVHRPYDPGLQDAAR